MLFLALAHRNAILLLLFFVALLVLPSTAAAQTVLRGEARGAKPAGNATVTTIDANTIAIDVNIVGGAGSGGSGGDGAIVDGVDPAIKATVFDFPNSNPLGVTLRDTNGDPVAVGGGTQYTEGDVDATITGTAILWEDAANTLSPVSAAKPLPVDVRNASFTVTGPLTDAQLRATAVPISGTVTATGPLTDTQLRATPVPVSGTVTASGPLTDTQLRATAVPVDGSGVTQPVSGTVTATGPLTDAQLRATAVPVSGTVTATGPLTDAQLRAAAVPVSGPLTDTQLRATAVPVSGTVTATGPLTDTQLRATPVPVSGTVTTTPPSNASTNVAQINGVTPLMGNGVTGTGSPRVTIASDNTAFTVNVGTFPDNEPFNVAQINGVTPLMGAGNTGTGSPRVTIASDQAAIQTKGQNGVTEIICDNTARYNAATSGSTELVALTSTQTIYVCGFKAQTTSATGVDVKLVYGTGTNCATAPADITMTWNLDTDITPGFVDNVSNGNSRKTAVSNALCINASGAVTVRAEINYAKF